MFLKEKFTFENLLKLLLSLFLFLLPWQTVYIYKDQFLNGVKWEYGTLDFYATEGLFWICAILFMGWYWERSKKYEVRIKNLRLTKDRVFVASVLLFILYCFLSITWAMDKPVAFQQAFRVLEAALLFCMLYLGPLPRHIAALSFVTGAVPPSLLGIWQFLSQATIGSTMLGLTKHTVDSAGTSVIVGDDIGRWLRAYGTFPHPNMFGGYLAVAVTSGLFLLHGEENRRQRMVLQGVLLVETTALFFTFSRSAWIALAMAGLLYSAIVFLQKKWRLLTPVISLLVCVCILVTVFSPLIHVRTEITSMNEKQSIDERVRGYHEAIELWKQHLWYGVGAGNYTKAIFEKDPTKDGWEYQPVHTVPLLFVTELGLIGVLLLVGMFISFLSYLVSSTTQRVSVLGCLPSATCLIILSVLDHYLFSSYPGFLMIVGFIAISGLSIHRLSTIHPPSIE